MHEFVTCFILWTKRLFRHPLFLFSLLLLPASVLFLQHSLTKDDALLQVALYAPADTSSNSLLQQITALSGTSVRFYSCRTPEEVREDVHTGKAVCGYLFPKQLDSRIKSYVEKRSPILTAIHQHGDVRSGIVNEILLSRLYPLVSYEILISKLSHKTASSIDHSWLSDTFLQNSSSELLFQFEYADGTENTLLNRNDSNYMLLPIRGIVAVMLFLVCMTGSLLCYSDQENRLFLAHPHKQRLCNLLALLVPGLFAGITGLFCIKIAGIMTSPAIEIPAMLLYLLCCMGFVSWLRSLFPSRGLFLATIPVCAIASVVISPIFLDLSDWIPAVVPLRNILPITHYLNAIHDSSASFSLLLLFFLSCFFSSLNSRIRG